jgi:outer membrane receptor for ferrienterochelin and colicins
MDNSWHCAIVFMFRQIFTATLAHFDMIFFTFLKDIMTFLQYSSIIQIILVLSFLLVSTVSFSCLASTKVHPDAAELKTRYNAAVSRYESDYFSKFSPQNAKDILDKIPGTSTILRDIDNGDSARGFGSGGDQILINGKRISGKMNGIAAELSRIQAKTVDYIELIRGTVAELDVQSEGLIINVVLYDAPISSTIWNTRTDYITGLAPLPSGGVSHSGSNEQFKYSLGYEYQVEPDKFIASETLTDNQHNVIETNQFETTDKWSSSNLSASIAYDFSTTSALRINSAYKFINATERKPIHRKYHGRILIHNDKNLEDNHYSKKEQDWEIGGDFTYKFKELGKFKIIFIANKSDGNEFNSQKNQLNNGIPVRTFQFDEDAITKEKILRVSLGKVLNQQHSLDAGLELAINNVNGVATFTQFSNKDELSIESSNIRENRYQAFVNHNFIISPTLNLQTSLVSEWSEVTLTTDYKTLFNSEMPQVSQLALNKDFSYLQPRINLRYDYTANNQLRLNIEKKVSQLDLTDFLPEFNEEQARLEPTNPQLLPEKSWVISLTYEHTFSDDQGSISLMTLHENITDHLTEIKLGNGSGTGNVMNAKKYGINLETTLRLSSIGLINTVINGIYHFETSDFTDPFTQLNRQINDAEKHLWSFELKHDAVELGLAYGFRIFSSSATLYNRRDYTSNFKPDTDAEAFIEYAINPTLKLRLETSELLLAKAERKRVRYIDDIGNSDIMQYEIRQQENPRYFSLELRGQF